MNHLKEHWDNIYATRNTEEVSWHQPYPKTSVGLAESLLKDKNAAIIDVGGGDSLLADTLLDLGYTDITVADISARALEKAKQRLGEKANRINFIASDILNLSTDKRFDLWHDRAAFHFLTSDENTGKYALLAEKHINTGGHLIIGTFSLTGPEKCSGLIIKRYSAEMIAAAFKNFTLVDSFEEKHQTPFNTSQDFIFAILRKI